MTKQQSLKNAAVVVAVDDDVGRHFVLSFVDYHAMDSVAFAFWRLLSKEFLFSSWMLLLSCLLVLQRAGEQKRKMRWWS